MLSFRMTGDEIAQCTDRELSDLVRLCRNHDGHFVIERDLALNEMGKRVAREMFAQARRDRRKAAVRMCR